ncbi:MAG: hypothetical protein A2428_17860 [Bdellovibrionales bacterium RIFOXYC1_FULL_54_43]|nr:MAG: hypothetical protein A2428_17860 [Bdellovibrionales bacterium RIFOXYC1_FULL_54_43]OFZ78344.1 MAG: hypothetical protein A2603_12460 [Bdellovibrionales bacterium RIFOXYD1_FULL_55_31]
MKPSNRLCRVRRAGIVASLFLFFAHSAQAIQAIESLCVNCQAAPLDGLQTPIANNVASILSISRIANKSSPLVIPKVSVTSNEPNPNQWDGVGALPSAPLPARPVFETPYYTDALGLIDSPSAPWNQYMPFYANWIFERSMLQAYEEAMSHRSSGLPLAPSFYPASQTDWVLQARQVL